MPEMRGFAKNVDEIVAFTCYPSLSAIDGTLAIDTPRFRNWSALCRAFMAFLERVVRKLCDISHTCSKTLKITDAFPGYRTPS